jgi:hypothetical protein
MESNLTPTDYQQVTVDVPEDRVAEFHAFFARFLAGPSFRAGRSRRGRGRPVRPHRGFHGHRCGGRHEATEHVEATGERSETTEV